MLFKEGTFTEGEEIPDPDPKKLLPTEQLQGVVPHVIGNTIQVEIVPKTALIDGTTIQSPIITVENSLPIANDVTIVPTSPNASSTLEVTFTIDDPEISSGEQTDSTQIRWSQSVDGGAIFTEIEELNDSKLVAPTFLEIGHQWKVEVVPSDGLELGALQTAGPVAIPP